MQKSGVVFGVHDAEADVFAVQAFEGGAVTDHETLTDAGVEDVPGGQAGLLDFQEDKNYIRQTRDLILSERTRLLKALENIPTYKTYPAYANFLLLQMHPRQNIFRPAGSWF